MFKVNIKGNRTTPMAYYIEMKRHSAIFMPRRIASITP